MKNFPTSLNRSNIFPSPIWMGDAPEYVKQINKISDPYIKQARKNFKKDISARNKRFGDKKDHGFVFHSTTLIQEKKLIDFHTYVTLTSANLLNEMGHDLKNHDIVLTESWVQEFAKAGGGHHTLHTHWNGHISGFYFLKVGERTSRPVFQDPRPGALMNGLPLKKVSDITYGTFEINYRTKPGTIMFFPSYMPHMFAVDSGHEPFRFIHFNVQAIPKLLK
tara:strand:- start:3885 stop:4547 length:663 start_codon:yes stop_codon:yes gene_type:complete